MSLDKKLENIRQKPEHIRKRYVWASVILCMFFVLMIWFFSIKTNFSSTNEESTSSFTQIQEQFDESGEPLPQMPSIEDFVTTQEQNFPEESQEEITDTDIQQNVETGPNQKDVPTHENEPLTMPAETLADTNVPEEPSAKEVPTDQE